MRLDFPLPTPLQYFGALVHGDEQLPLLEAAASLAQDEYPELDIGQVLLDLDRLGARLRRRVRPDADALERLQALNRFFFGDLGFGGNLNDYHNPDNSYLHRVLHTRRGIPVSLAVLWLELAHGLGLPAQGVAFPAHFLVQVVLPAGRLVIDPFSGQTLSREDLRARLEELEPLPAAEAFGGHGEPGLLLRAATPREILARMLHNLQHLHRQQEDWQRLVAVQDRLIVLRPRAWEAYRDRGLALAQLGQAAAACADLRLYLQQAVDAQDRGAIGRRLRELDGPF